jgi:AraC-like DNA-binding protein
MSADGRLLNFLGQFQFEPLNIHRAVDPKKRLAQTFDPDFPFLMRFYSFPGYREMLGANWLNWHEHLEMILPVSGSGRFRAGEQTVEFEPGDLLLVDNLKMHGMVDLRSEHKSLVIYFLPEFIYNVGSCQSDATFLSPFLERAETAQPILRHTDSLAAPVHEALMRLVTAFFQSDSVEDRQAGCKLHLLEMLFHLRRHFELQGTVSAGYAQQRQRVQRLKRLFEYLNAHYAQKILLSDAAALVGMSETRFKEFFKRATGHTFTQHLIHLRLNRASQLLRDTDHSMAEIAQQTGFCDQSHFDNRFKGSFHLSPKDYRTRHRDKVAA